MTRSAPTLWLRITALGILALLAATPFFAHLIQGMVEKSGKPARFPLAALLAMQGVQTVLVLALAAWAGGKLGPKLGLDAPVLRGAERLSGIPLAMLAGTLATLGMVALEHAFKPFLPEALQAAKQALGGPLLGFSASFYGGIIEEILLRWGVLTALAALLYRLRVPLRTSLAVANVAAALIFGAGHLPAVSQLHVPLNLPLVAYIVLVNALGGVVFGWLFLRHGLERAMIAHFTADLWLHVVFAAL